MTKEWIRRGGVAVMAGGVLWAAGMLAAGPLADDELNRIELFGSLAWQLGVLALLGVMAVTRATGTGRFGRSLLAVATALVLLAMGWTVGALLDPVTAGEGIMVALDAAWPLSMLWLLVVAVAVARVGQWTGRARWAPLIAKLWVVVALLTMAVLPEWPALVVRSVAMAALFGWLGWVIVSDIAPGKAVADNPRRPLPGPSLSSEVRRERSV